MSKVRIDLKIGKYIRHQTAKEIFSVRLIMTLAFIPAYCMFAVPTKYAYLPLPFLALFIGVQFLNESLLDHPWLKYASPITGLLLNASVVFNTGFQKSPFLFLILMPIITYAIERGPRWAPRSAMINTPLLAFLGLRALLQLDWQGISYVLAMTATAHTTSRFIRKTQEITRFHASVLEDIATTDPLTGLYNRRALKTYMEEMISRGIPFGFILCDLDGFKAYNDRYGHQAGDEVLKAFGRLLRKALRPVDVAFRYGGDEFAIVLFEGDNLAARLATERIGGTILREMNGLGASFGTALFPIDGRTAGEIIEVADKRLYEAKGARQASPISIDESKLRNEGRAST